MEARELRTGNFAWKDKVIVTIDGRSIMDIQFSKGYAEKYTPVTLTEEWLLKFGFEKLDRFFEKDEILLLLTSGVVLYHYSNRSDARATLKHVHQLQNLFYALTGRELEVKKNEISYQWYKNGIRVGDNSPILKNYKDL